MKTNVVPQIKICGLRTLEDAHLINEEKIEYAGVVIFYPKSKRNNTKETAKIIIDTLDKSVNKVAVCVSPTKGEIKIIEELGFDYIQIHGEL